MIDGIHTTGKKCQRSRGKDAKTDLVYGNVLYKSLALQRQIDDSKNHGTETAGNKPPVEEIFNMLFHTASYLLLISAKHRLETYSR